LVRHSPHVLIESGVHQGLVLHHNLFLSYINDMPVGLSSTMRLFADDTIAFMAL